MSCPPRLLLILLMLQDCRIRILDADKLQASRSLQVSYSNSLAP